jgi:hypothetical protein
LDAFFYAQTMPKHLKSSTVVSFRSYVGEDDSYESSEPIDGC